MTTPANPADLLAFVRAQLDDDVRGVREWIEPREDGMLSTPLRPVHQLTDRVGAERMLAEVDAKRRILDDYEAALAESDSDPNDPTRSADASTLEWVVRLLASPYADRPGYREEWRP